MEVVQYNPKRSKLNLMEGLKQIQKTLKPFPLSQFKPTLQKVKGWTPAPKALRRECFRNGPIAFHRRNGWIPFNGRKPLSDHTAYIGDVNPIGLWDPDDLSQSIEITGKYYRCGLEILVGSVNDATQFFRKWGGRDKQWIWQLQHEWEKETSFGQHANTIPL